MSPLSDLIHGRGVHVDPIRCVEDLTREVAAQPVPDLPHTVWQVLGHMNYWIDWGLKRIEGVETGLENEQASWPTVAGLDDDLAWQHEIGFFRTNLDQLATLADARASTLSRILDRGTGQTVEGILWELVLHNSYHLGQIVQLRRILHAWPPVPR
ncbi:MAG: DinB family protein [Gemmatimonadales bacterium]